MTIPLTGSGGLFTILGKMAFAAKTANTFRGTDLVTENAEAIAALDGLSDALRATVVPELLSAETTAQSSLSSYLTSIRSAAERLLIEMVNEDNPLVEQTVEASLIELVRQMRVNADYVDANTVTMGGSGISVVGDGAVAISKWDAFGRTLENALAEDLEISAYNVSTPASATLRVRGEAVENDRLSFNYPAGSGCDVFVTAVDAADSSFNLVPNGAFENWTASALDNWSAIVGAFGTDWVKETTTVYKGTNAIKLVGDGASLSQIRTDITANVEAGKQYLAAIWVRRGASAIAAGELTVDLYDGSAVVKDNAGVNQSNAIDLTTLTTSFVPYLYGNFGFRIPDPKPTTLYLRLRLSAAITNTRTVFLDHFGLAEGTQLYPGGPYMGAFSGAVDWNAQDFSGGGSGGTRSWRYVVANNLASDWQHWFDRLFDMRGFGLVLPIAGTTLINDNLIA